MNEREDKSILITDAGMAELQRNSQESMLDKLSAEVHVPKEGAKPLNVKNIRPLESMGKKPPAVESLTDKDEEPVKKPFEDEANVLLKEHAEIDALESNEIDNSSREAVVGEFKKEHESKDMLAIKKIVATSQLTYAELSKLKQRRVIKRVNKVLKRADMKLMTHNDMLKQTNWKSMEGVNKDIVMSVLTTLNTLGKVITHPLIPASVLDSDLHKALMKYYESLGVTLLSSILEVKAVHWTKEDGFKSGNVPDSDHDDFVKCISSYLEIRTELIEIMGSLSESLSKLLEIIKIEKLKELSVAADDKAREEGLNFVDPISTAELDEEGFEDIDDKALTEVSDDEFNASDLEGLAEAAASEKATSD